MTRPTRSSGRRRRAEVQVGVGVKVLASRSAFRGRLIDVRVDRVRLPSGRETVREVVRHPGAAAVVPLLPDGRVLLVEQYRYAPDATLLEIPAGTLDPGESPRACAERELEEETGHRARHWTRLAAFLAAPGTLDEVITVFLATGLEPGVRSLDADEEGLTLRSMPLDAAIDLARRGKIRDGKSIVGLLLAGEAVARRTSRGTGKKASATAVTSRRIGAIRTRSRRP